MFFWLIAYHSCYYSISFPLLEFLILKQFSISRNISSRKIFCKYYVMLYFLPSYISKKNILCLGTEMIFTKCLDHNFSFKTLNMFLYCFLAFILMDESMTTWDAFPLQNFWFFFLTLPRCLKISEIKHSFWLSQSRSLPINSTSFFKHSLLWTFFLLQILNLCQPPYSIQPQMAKVLMTFSPWHLTH